MPRTASRKAHGSGPRSYRGLGSLCICFTFTTTAIKPNSESPSSIKDKRSRSGGRAPPLSQAPAPAAPAPQLAPAPASPGGPSQRDCSREPSCPSLHGEIRSRGRGWECQMAEVPSAALLGQQQERWGEGHPRKVQTGFQVSCSGKASFVEEVWGPSARLQSMVLKGRRVRMEVCLALSPGDCRSVPEGPSLHFRMRT